MSSSPLKEQPELIQHVPKIQVNPNFHLKKTHINLGHSKDKSYVSMNQIQQQTVLFQSPYQKISKDTKFRLSHFSPNSTLYNTQGHNSAMSMNDDLNKMKKELASSHIQIGDQTTTMKDVNTHHKDQFKVNPEVSPDVKNKNEKLSAHLKKENFQIAQFNNNLLNQKNLANFYTSVYRNNADLERLRNAKPAQKSDFNALVASVNLGSN